MPVINELKAIRIHRFHDHIAFDANGTETLYLPPHLAEQFGKALLQFAEDVRKNRFVDSTLETASIE